MNECDQELCPHWSGFGNVCPCALFNLTRPHRCHGCYDSISGPWCDNCDQWPCICLEDK